MKKVLIIIALLLSAGVLFYFIHNVITSEKIQWAEGHIEVSPSQRWVVYIKSTSTSIPDKSYCKIFIFDTIQYPNLKTPGQFPTAAQKNNPRASYLLPVQLHARLTDIEWSPDSTYVLVRQAPRVGNPSLAYRVDLDTFGLHKIDVE